MSELTTEYWSLLLPDEWSAEQDEDTIFITDEDEASVIEISTLVRDEELSLESLVEALAPDARKVTLSGLPARYQELEEEGVFWREWYCDAGETLLIVSHGSDVSNCHLDDDIVDEILSTLSPRVAS